MANEYATDIIRITALLPIEVKLRAEKAAAEQGKTLSRFVAEVVAAAVVGVPLTAEDHTRIAEHIERQQKLRIAKREKG